MGGLRSGGAAAAGSECDANGEWVMPGSADTRIVITGNPQAAAQ